MTSPSYLAEVTLPALRRGRGRDDLTGFDVCLPVFAVLGADAEARAVAEAGVRRQIAFYASTPPYRPVLEHHGRGALADELNGLSRRQAWDEMTGLVDDDLLALFAVAGDPAGVASGIADRYRGLVDRVSLNTPYDADPTLVLDVVTRLRAA